MGSKIVRFSKALRNESAKRVPIIIILGVALLLWSNYANGQKANATLNKIAELGQQIKDISQQNRQLSLDNKNLSTQLNDKTDNINKHVDCVVSLWLPNKPLPGASDIEDCKATFAAPSTTSPAPKSSSPQSAPKENNGQSNNTQTAGNSGNTPPKSPDCTVDLLGLHLGRCK